MGYYFNKEENLRYKYAEIPEEPRQYKARKGRKKSKAQARSDHKHIYAVATKLVRYAGSDEWVHRTDEHCTICGKFRSHYKH